MKPRIVGTLLGSGLAASAACEQEAPSAAREAEAKHEGKAAPKPEGKSAGTPAPEPVDYCGAHQSIDGGDRMLVLGGEAREWPTIELPEAVKTAAATGEMFDLYAACEGDTTLDAFVRDTMRWSGLAIALEAGAPRATWTFTADVYYACSPDYLATGHTTTDLLPEASALGLSPPRAREIPRARRDAVAARRERGAPADRRGGSGG